MSESTQTAILGGGCFWCLDAVYRNVVGVVNVTSGYAGGHVADPTYEQVSRGDTGHAEVVRVEFDPERISYRDLLGIFFSIHDPTTKDRQGADVGPQYRSALFVMDDSQERVAYDVLADLHRDGVWDGKIVTEVERLDKFYPAEAYHQNFFANNPDQGYCSVVIAPKLSKFRKQFAPLLKVPQGAH